AEITSIPPPDMGKVYSWRLLEEILFKEKEKLSAEYLFGVLDEAIEDNWYSRTIHSKNICFISTKNWEYLSNLPVTSFVAYEIVENLTEMLMGEVNPHIETMGCLYDMCIMKLDISFKIRTADICQSCLDILKDKLGESHLAAIIKMLEKIRLIAIGRSDCQIDAHSSQADFVDKKYPFPIAYCFRSMQSELNATRKFFKMLELHEVLIKYVTIVGLAAINDSRPDHMRKLDLKVLYRPTTGQWHEIFARILRILTRDTSLRFLRNWTVSIKGNLINKFITASEKLVRLRNETRGHGFMSTDSGNQQLFLENIDHINLMLKVTSPLA